MLSFANNASSQTRLALEAEIGLTIPLSSSAQSVIGLEDIHREDGIIRGTPHLADHWNGVGSEFSIALIMGEAAIRYSLNSLPWSHIIRVCEAPPLTNQQEPVVFPNDEIDDAEVEYICNSEIREEIPEGEAPLTLHHLTFERRFQFAQYEISSFYWSFGIGSTFTRYRGGGIAGPMRIGGNGTLGGGVELTLDSLIVLIAEFHGRAYFLKDATPMDASARRSSARGHGIANTLFDTGYLFSGIAGIRVYFQ